jgi:hypothetical protein
MVNENLVAPHFQEDATAPSFWDLYSYACEVYKFVLYI